jgi:hypothetical protein
MLLGSPKLQVASCKKPLSFRAHARHQAGRRGEFAG